VQGLVIDNYETDLPIKKGLSSSAAICVLAARAFNQIYDLKLTTRGEMELAYQGEITTPSRCGRMDQACAFGQRPVLMTFDGAHLSTSELRLGQDLYLVIADLRAQKDTMKILAELNHCYPIAENEIALGVQNLLGPINQRMVHGAVQALQAGNAERLGALMWEAQAYFDRYAMPACPEELTAPVLHRVLGYAPLQPHIWGGKGVGSQGDGSAQFVARSEEDQQAAASIIEQELAMPCHLLALRATSPPEHPERDTQPRVTISVPHGKQKLRKAVIPAAGMGTRLFPATKAIKKELFPVVNRDGIAKPAILVTVEEALDAGLEEIVIVVQPGEKERFRALFDVPVSSSKLQGLPEPLQAYEQRLLEMGRHVTFAVQFSQEGFGHAVYCAREAIGEEPFLLILGDHLFHSSNEKSCSQQLLDAYEEHGMSILGLRVTPEHLVSHYGVATGIWLEEGRLLRMTEIVEKPTAGYASTRLRVPGLPEREYLTVFGLYALEPQIFGYLGRHITGDTRALGEFQLTTALDELREEDGFLGLVIEGQSYDIGLPNSYVQTLQRLRKA
jgi:UTP-glucose-1-phosphate uridylyltransferase/mevalonate kinase